MSGAYFVSATAQVELRSGRVCAPAAQVARAAALAEQLVDDGAQLGEAAKVEIHS